MSQQNYDKSKYTYICGMEHLKRYKGSQLLTLSTNDLAIVLVDMISGSRLIPYANAKNSIYKSLGVNR